MKGEYTDLHRVNNSKGLTNCVLVLKGIQIKQTMSEVVGVTELQEMEAEVKLLKAKLEKAKDAENTSVACSRIVASVTAAQSKDGFLVTEECPPNRFHTSQSGGDGGCCVIS